MVASLVPTFPQLATLAAVTGAVLSLLGLGALVRGPAGDRDADLVVGWGIATFVLTVAGMAAPGHLQAGAWACVAAGAMAAAIMARRHALMPIALPWTLVLAAPLLLLVTAMQPSQWDEFSQWLYSIRYLLDYGAFPVRGGPSFDGSFASYPFANAFPAVMAAVLGGGFLENAGALVNLCVCLAYAVVLAGLMADAAGSADAARRPAVAALALLAATLANPTFVPKVVFTAYADAPTALALTLVGISGWRLFAVLAGDRHRSAIRLTLQAGLAGATLVSLKQANLVLFLLVLGGLGLVALRDGRLRHGRTGAHMGLMAAIALAPYLLWRWHVAHNFPGAEFTVRPVAAWALDILPQILARMGSVAANKGGHFTVLAVMLVLMLRGLWRMRTPFDRLAVIAGAVGIGYNAFLLFAYVTAFDRGEALSVASFWRYNMHVGGLTWAALIYGLAGRWRWSLPRAATAGLCALVAAAPLATVKFLRFDIHAPKLYVRAVGTELRALLPDGARLTVVDPVDSGFYGLLIKYLLHDKAAVDRLYLDQPPDTPEAIGGRLASFGATHAWVHIPTDAARRTLGCDLAAGASHLLARSPAGGWNPVASWPYPGYGNPHDIRD